MKYEGSQQSVADSAISDKHCQAAVQATVMMALVLICTEYTCSSGLHGTSGKPASVTDSDISDKHCQAAMQATVTMALVMRCCADQTRPACSQCQGPWTLQYHFHGSLQKDTRRKFYLTMHSVCAIVCLKRSKSSRYNGRTLRVTDTRIHPSVL